MYNFVAEIHPCTGVLGAFVFPSVDIAWVLHLTVVGTQLSGKDHEDSAYTAMVAIVYRHLGAETHPFFLLAAIACSTQTALYITCHVR